jgi:hypothetical protein
VAEAAVNRVIIIVFISLCMGAEPNLAFKTREIMLSEKAGKTKL